MPTVDQTLQLVKRAHALQCDKAGRPYWQHLEAVKDDLRGIPEGQECEWRCAALLHDVLEDTPMIADDLRDLGYSEATIKAVQTVTKPKSSGVDYLDFIRSIAASQNPMAIQIKLFRLETQSRSRGGERKPAGTLRQGASDPC